MTIELRTSLPGPKATELVEKYLRQHMGLFSPPYSFFPDSKNPGNGAYARDVDGNVFLDLTCNIAVAPLGYAHPRQVKTTREYANVGTTQYAGHDFIPPEHGYLVKKLAEISKNLNPEFDSAFLINSGAEAVENAMKICFRNKGKAKTGISFTGAFHGRTLGALSATTSKTIHKKHYPEIPMRKLPFADNEEKEQISLSLLEDTLKKDIDPENVAFLIVEPVQGEGGYRFATKGFLQGLRKITKEHGIMLIDDEVQAGMGRTGKWFAMEHFAVKPDLTTLGKSLQVAAVVGNKNTFPQEDGSISSTFGGGDVIKMAMGLEIINTIEDEKLLDRCTKMGEYFLKQLRELESKYSGKIANPRGLGLLLAFDMESSKETNAFVEASFKKGLLTLPCGPKSIRVIPPYIIKENEVDEAIGVMSRVLSASG